MSEKLRDLLLTLLLSSIGVLLASCIPAASIFTLYFVQSMVDRLGVIVAYSAIFSICLGVFTTARRVEIFGESLHTKYALCNHNYDFCVWEYVERSFGRLQIYSSTSTLSLPKLIQ